MATRGRMIGLGLLVSSSWLVPEARASEPTEPPAPVVEPPAAAPQPQPPRERSLEGVPLMVSGGVLMAGGAASAIAGLFIATGDGLAGGSGWTPVTKQLAVAAPAALITGGAFMLGGGIWNARANRRNATARRWTPTVALGLDGGQFGVRIRF